MADEEQNLGGTIEDRKTEQGQMPVPGFADWGDLVAAMRAMRTSVFPVDSVVRVDDPRFHGIGIVSRDEACPIEKLAVRVESLNVWWYPIEHCADTTKTLTRLLMKRCERWRFS